ncbi:hypothetical protein QTP70_023613 [Hemibagrus guttatus]|uniref:Uncharacterized protein n=1 Tax=Hemibagrus guttatus TaxID=175788 RepID=A0AAE0USE3_9TELE|nr:hypothetical protein QTP70_023613 [Hemibagrus guttatus]KAK3541475.1 hypothetical protein QTP86_026257 [Hemibagrus guttatus]
MKCSLREQDRMWIWMRQGAVLGCSWIWLLMRKPCTQTSSTILKTSSMMMTSSDEDLYVVL